MDIRPLIELIDTRDPAWPGLTRKIDRAKNAATLLPPSPSAHDDLLKLQITTHSTLGALVAHSGGLLVDHGWVRLLGSWSERLGRSLAGWNESTGRKGLFLVGDDVLGGVLAINGGRLNGEKGHVHYFAPDALRWEDLGRGYTDFVAFLLQGDLEEFYGGKRWQGWQTDVEDLPGDLAFSFYPPLWTNSDSIDQRSRRAIPLKELVELSGAM